MKPNLQEIFHAMEMILICRAKDDNPNRYSLGGYILGEMDWLAELHTLLLPLKEPRMIAELIGEYRYLSNFWNCFIEYEGDMYPSVENAYQAAKTDNWAIRRQFFHVKSSEAKRLGKIITLKKDWETLKLTVMYNLVLAKFTTYPQLGFKLVSTGKQEIQEGNWWGDCYWGTVNGIGENHLGKILMRVREEIRQRYS